jgi:uncharacterized protein
MQTRDGYPPGVPCWIDTSRDDPQAAADFYAGVFGWAFEERMPADVPGSYLVATLGGRDVAAIGSRPEGAPPDPSWATYVWVDAADEAAALAREHGATVLVEPFDVLEAGRMAVVADPAGAPLSLWQAARHRGAQVVNEHGTWNWSNLNTSDPEGAIAFYGAVFGWEAQTLDFGAGESIMWRMPGYGDFLAGAEPGIRERQADVGAPPGFEDAIAWIQPIDDGMPANWSVTFHVRDTDETARRAAALGGDVLVEPFDLWVVRSAVLRDPDGAVFTVNTFTPE